MKKKMLFGVTLLASAITLSMSSCDKSKTQEPQTPQTEKATPTDGMKIAYVEVDSIMTNYTKCLHSRAGSIYWSWFAKATKRLASFEPTFKQ